MRIWPWALRICVKSRGRFSFAKRRLWRGLRPRRIPRSCASCRIKKLSMSTASAAAHSCGACLPRWRLRTPTYTACAMVLAPAFLGESYDSRIALDRPMRLAIAAPRAPRIHLRREDPTANRRRIRRRCTCRASRRGLRARRAAPFPRPTPVIATRICKSPWTDSKPGNSTRRRGTNSRTRRHGANSDSNANVTSTFTLYSTLGCSSDGAPDPRPRRSRSLHTNARRVRAPRKRMPARIRVRAATCETSTNMLWRAIFTPSTGICGSRPSMRE